MWKLIKDEMPPEVTPVMVSDGEHIWVAYYLVFSSGNIYWNAVGATGWEIENEFDDPTYWMELPAPPEKL